MSRDALVVGINRYRHLHSLQLPAGDAEAVARLLRQYGDFRIRRLPERIGDDGELVIAPDVEVSTRELQDAIVQLLRPGGGSGG